MIDFPSSFAQFIFATFIPLYLGMFFVILLREVGRVSIRNLSAFALGLIFWFFLDTLNDAIQLGVNEGYSFGFQHTTLLLLFVVGFLSLALLSGLDLSDRRSAGSAPTSSPLLVAILVALGMGFHGIGEGLGFGATAAGTSAVSVLGAIGGYSGGISYVLHKFLEASIVMIVFVALTDEGKSVRKRLRQTIALGLVFGIPSMLGEVVGYFAPIDSSYFFALGGGAALFVGLLVVRPIFGDDKQMTQSQWVKIVLSLLIGFLSLYSAAAFHAG